MTVKGPRTLQSQKYTLYVLLVPLLVLVLPKIPEYQISNLNAFRFIVVFEIQVILNEVHRMTLNDIGPRKVYGAPCMFSLQISTRFALWPTVIELQLLKMHRITPK